MAKRRRRYRGNHQRLSGSKNAIFFLGRRHRPRNKPCKFQAIYSSPTASSSEEPESHNAQSDERLSGREEVPENGIDLKWAKRNANAAFASAIASSFGVVLLLVSLWFMWGQFQQQKRATDYVRDQLELQTTATTQQTLATEQQTMAIIEALTPRLGAKLELAYSTDRSSFSICLENFSEFPVYIDDVQCTFPKDPPFYKFETFKPYIGPDSKGKIGVAYHNADGQYWRNVIDAKLSSVAFGWPFTVLCRTPTGKRWKAEFITESAEEIRFKSINSIEDKH